MGFGGPLYYIFFIRNPQNRIGNDLGPCTVTLNCALATSFQVLFAGRR